MSHINAETVGGESPWEIMRAYPYVTIAPLVNERLQISCAPPDERGRPFVRALERLTVEEMRRDAERESPDDEGLVRTDAARQAAAMARLFALVRHVTGAEPPALKMFYNEAHGRHRHPSAQAERLRGRRPRRCG